jgi:hypothetical protein
MLGYTVRMTSGTVSDRVQKRKPLVLIGYSLSAASKPFFALAGGWAEMYLPCGRQTGSARGSGLLPAMRSLASQCTRARSAARSGCTALDGSGWWGHNRPPGGLCALSTRRVYGDILYLSLVPAAIAVIILIFFVKEKFAPVQVKKSIAGNIRAGLCWQKKGLSRSWR